MSLKDRLSVEGIQSHSSSLQSTPEKYGYLGYTLRGSEIYQKFPKSGPKRELLKTCFDKETKIKPPLKSRMLEMPLKACNKNLKNAENRKGSSSNSGSRKQPRKGENPFRFTPSMEKSDFGCSTSWICKNSACRALLSLDDAFCRRCSCCICHRFDDNKDPSLWLVCESQGSLGDSCGLSCHIECALEQEKLGVVKLGQYMQLDGSYCCASCGKVSGILGCWKKQLSIAKDARRVDVLCYRVFLSYRLLDNTSKFKELHEIVTEAKAKLEAEVGPMNGESVKMARGIVSRLAVAGDVQKLCSNAIDKAEEWLAKVPSSTADCTGCKENHAAVGNPAADVAGPSSGFRVRDLGKILHLAWAHEQGHSEGIYNADIEQYCGVTKSESPKAHLSPPPPISRNLDLNIANVPDLNEVLTPPLESSRDEPYDDAASNGIGKNGLARSNGSGPSDDLQAWPPTHNRDVPAVDSLLEAQRKRASSAMEEAHDCDSTLVNGSPHHPLAGAGSLDGNFEYCVKIIRLLECQGHIKQEFRLKLLTWFSLRSSEQERRVVHTFIRTLMDEPKSLAGQLVDTFSDLISCKRPRNGFTSFP